METDSPYPIQTSRSFSRYEPQTPPVSALSKSSAEVEEKAPVSLTPLETKSPEQEQEKSHSDIFESREDAEPEYEVDASSGSFPDGFDALPIEIQSLMERYVRDRAVV